uniref:Putative secreted protein n=1 Tax=Anopheles marajoara TaxID=58244 RepID=A0A2M4CEL8_9DIPT
MSHSWLCSMLRTMLLNFSFVTIRSGACQCFSTTFSPSLPSFDMPLGPPDCTGAPSTTGPAPPLASLLST